MASLGNKNKDDRSTRRAGGWRSRSLAARYDVVIVGDGALAAAVAWALTRTQPERRVALLAPALMGQHWDPSCVARLHALRPDARVRSLLPRATLRYRAWAEELGLDEDQAELIWKTLIDWNVNYEKGIIVARRGSKQPS